jgi:hypothetical protein
MVALLLISSCSNVKKRSTGSLMLVCMQLSGTCTSSGSTDASALGAQEGSQCAEARVSVQRSAQLCWQGRWCLLCQQAQQCFLLLGLAQVAELEHHSACYSGQRILTQLTLP